MGGPLGAAPRRDLRMPAAGAAAWGGGLLALLAPLPVTLGVAALGALALLAATAVRCLLYTSDAADD